MTETQMIIVALVLFIVIDIAVIGWLVKSGRIKGRPPAPASAIIKQRSGSDVTAQSDDDPKFPKTAASSGELEQLQQFNRRNGD